jgi:citrate synthase
VTELIDVPPGLADVAVTDTTIGDVVGDAGYYHYRGRSAPELARTSSFETVAALVLDTPSPLRADDRRLPPEVAALVDRIDLRTGISALGSALGLRPLVDLTHEERVDDAGRLISALPTLIASIRHGQSIEPDPGLGHVADFLRCSGGPSPRTRRWRRSRPTWCSPSITASPTRPSPPGSLRRPGPTWPPASLPASRR